jgi:hypothetical protein
VSEHSAPIARPDFRNRRRQRVDSKAEKLSDAIERLQQAVARLEAESVRYCAALKSPLTAPDGQATPEAPG